LQAQKAKVKKFEKKANHQLTQDGHEMDKQNEHAVQKSKTATDDHLAKQSEGVQGIEVEVRRKQAQEEGSLRNQMCKAPFERTGVANCKVYKQTAKLTEKLGEIALIRQQIANIKLDEQELGDGAKQDLDQQMKEARKKLAKQRKKLNTIIDDGQKLYDSMPHPHPRKNFADIARSKVHKHSEKTNKEAAERLEVYELHVTLLKAKEGKGGPEDLTGSSQKLKSELGTDSKGKYCVYHSSLRPRRRSWRMLMTRARKMRTMRTMRMMSLQMQIYLAQKTRTCCSTKHAWAVP
jgi:hypothetical protein